MVVEIKKKNYNEKGILSNLYKAVNIKTDGVGDKARIIEQECKQ